VISGRGDRVGWIDGHSHGAPAPLTTEWTKSGSQL